MRIPLILALAAVTSAPLAAQSANTRISIVNGDSTINISRGKVNSCSVEVNGRKLSDSEAKPICESHLSLSLDWNLDPDSDLVVKLDSLRTELRLNSDDFPKLNLKLQREAQAMARELASRSKALSVQGRALALGRDSTLALNIWPSILDSTLSNKAIIGVTVDTRAKPSDRYGAYVSGVTPSGPADQAGLVAGDIITSLDGKSMTSGPVGREIGPDESRPAARLVEVAAALKPGIEVKLDYRRGDANRSTEVTPVKGSSTLVSMSGDLPFRVFADTIEFSRPDQAYLDGVPVTSRLVPRAGGLGFAFGRVLGNTELAAMNPGLKGYFGTSDGVLIVKSDSDHALGLKSGDVVLSIDGREIRSPSELGRVLRSYESGDQVKLSIMRNKEKQLVKATLP